MILPRPVEQLDEAPTTRLRLAAATADEEAA